MVLTKMVINSVAGKLAKHFRLNKVMSYVFDKNELDEKVERLEKRVSIMENFKCNYKKEDKDG